MLSRGLEALCELGRERNGDGEEVGFREMRKDGWSLGRGEVPLDNEQYIDGR